MGKTSVMVSMGGVLLEVRGYHEREEREWFDAREGVGNPASPASFEVEDIRHSGKSILPLLEGCHIKHTTTSTEGQVEWWEDILDAIEEAALFELSSQEADRD